MYQVLLNYIILEYVGKCKEIDAVLNTKRDKKNMLRPKICYYEYYNC